jgi:leader peptidase (prepilin peptidase)/N-methyltransferase
LLAAGTLAVIALRVDDVLVLAALCWTALLAIALAVIDAREHRLPDRLTLLALGGMAIGLSGAAVLGHQTGRLLVAAICAAVTAAFYLLLALLPRGYGLGDVKLGLVTGFAAGWYGPRAAVTATLVAVMLAGLAALVVAVATSPRRNSLAHGPFMLLGALTAIALAAA